MVFAGTGVWKSKRGTPLLGRRTSKNDEQYSYNVRDELISADEVSYAHDDIGLHAPTSVSEVGNRTTAEGKTYTANNLNQYTAIDDFAPQYDDDGIHAPTSMSEVGNQTLIKTETGIWSVTYNAENRPIRWQSGDTVITMSFDRMGRRNVLTFTYYNYRHYDVQNGRWTGRDRHGEEESSNLYLSLLNSVMHSFDYLGESRRPTIPETAMVIPIHQESRKDVLAVIYH